MSENSLKIFYNFPYAFLIYIVSPEAKILCFCLCLTRPEKINNQCSHLVLTPNIGTKVESFAFLTDNLVFTVINIQIIFILVNSFHLLETFKRKVALRLSLQNTCILY